MTRWAIGLSIWALFGMSVAHAAPAGARCERGVREVVLPQPGATHVPRNTKIWAVGQYYPAEQLSASGATITIEPTNVGDDRHPATRYDVPDLEPQREYVVQPTHDGPTTQFTTGADVDLVAPAAPLIRRTRIATTPGDHAADEDLGELQLDAAFDPDTALVRIEITGGRERITMLTVPGDWQVGGEPACDTQLPVRLGDHVQIAITAIDLAGNESQPSVQQVEVALGSSMFGPGAGRHHSCCGCAGPIMLLFLGVYLFVPLLVIAFGAVLIANLWSRRRALRSAAAEPLSSLAGEHLLRRKQLRAGLVAVLGVTGLVVFVLQGGGGSEWLWFLSPVLAGIGIRGVVAARACLAMIERGADVMSLAHRLVVTAGDVEKSVDLDTEKIARARERYAVPPSIARARTGRSSS